jgi:hypothetical protein
MVLAAAQVLLAPIAHVQRALTPAARGPGGLMLAAPDILALATLACVTRLRIRRDARAYAPNDTARFGGFFVPLPANQQMRQRCSNQSTRQIPNRRKLQDRTGGKSFRCISRM